ncbi:SRPBCC domain-containing protein [Hymenobacter sp. ASUV-10]|uniref:SRPBCC domain-containing protein n=1 Tax=Hymenobacter aranciens TaxID=3063996 RepID=A0ABT9BA91_9BACT|nr:SRPBCC domain-containing protein [Hymenobacter sp. ASUV-10]MDO7875102.1 SRPBCC domain-containing protein [Hymenobacter sp. ASUV-10]
MNPFTPTPPTAEELLITRTLKAPRPVVFRAFAEREQLEAWWGPKGFPLEVRHFDFRPGGRFHYGMHMPDGSIMWGKFDYLEIDEPQKIGFINSFSDEAGGTTRAPFEGIWPLEMLNEFTLAEAGDNQTLLTLRVKALNASPEEQATFNEGVADMREGFNGTIDSLVELLEKATTTR